jgi:hypothetical protein
MVGSDEDYLELGGHRMRSPRIGERDEGGAPMTGNANKFLSIWFRCCHVYGRLNRNATHTAYEGRCPRCGAMVHARIGPDGTSRRMFEAG